MRVLKQWPTTSAPRQDKYSPLFDGKIYDLAEGKDFTGNPDQMRMLVYSAARHRGVLVKTLKKDGHLILQAVGERPKRKTKPRVM